MENYRLIVLVSNDLWLIAFFFFLNLDNVWAGKESQELWATCHINLTSGLIAFKLLYLKAL